MKFRTQVEKDVLGPENSYDNDKGTNDTDKDTLHL